MDLAESFLGNSPWRSPPYFSQRPPLRLGAYALTDRATWIKAADPATSQILVDGDPKLFNPYEVILVNVDKHPHVNVAAATAFIDWLVSEEGKRTIADYRVNGEQVFTPAPGPTN